MYAHGIDTDWLMAFADTTEVKKTGINIPKHIPFVARIIATAIFLALAIWSASLI